MSTGITGTYDGEGPNVAAGSTTQAGPVAISPDVALSGVGGGVAKPVNGGQGKTQGVAINRRRALRVSSEGARGSIAINYGGGDQILASYSRGIYITTAGNLAVRFVDDSADVTLTGLTAGQWYPFCIAIVRQAASTAAGFLLF